MIPEDLHSRLAALKEALAGTAVARDRAGGTAKRERDRIRRSGLLALAVPAAYGGAGASWPVTLGAARELAQVDSALAHLFAFQHLQVATIQLFAAPAQQAVLLEATAAGPLFWGNALNPRDRRTTLTPRGGGWRLDGAKSFCSGATDSDRLLVSAEDPDGRIRVVAVPTARAGITVLDDWDNMGQRQTDSGTVTFQDVAVAADEVLGPPGPFGDAFATLRPSLAQAVLATLYLGIAQGALAEAGRFLAARDAAPDPFVLRHGGKLHVAVAAAEALGERALARLQAAWDEGRALTPEGRGEAAVAITTFKAAAHAAGLAVTNGMFELMGARATAARYGHDRFWRNLRTHTLHDPIDHKLRELGDWALSGRYPEPGYYS